MNDNELRHVATNLTAEEFKAYCKGSSLCFMQKALNENGGDKKRASRFVKQMQFFDAAFDKYKHLCK